MPQAEVSDCDSDIDDASGISTHHIVLHMVLSNCVVQVMRVWSFPAASAEDEDRDISARRLAQLT